MTFARYLANFAIELYDKYRFNLKEINALLQSGKIFDWGKERDLLLSEIDDKDLYSFLNEFQVFLKKIVKNIGSIKIDEGDL